jgi:hypothetical protein
VGYIIATKENCPIEVLTRDCSLLLEQDGQVSLLTEPSQADQAFEQRLAINVEEAVVQITDLQA